MSLLALPQELLVEIMLLLPLESIAALASVSRLFSCLARQKRLWLALLRRDYPNFSYQEAVLEQYRAAALLSLTETPLTLAPVAPYCARRIYLTLKYLTTLSSPWRRFVGECRASAIAHWWLIDLCSPLTLSQVETRIHGKLNKRWVARSTCNLMIKKSNLDSTQYEVAIYPLASENSIYPSSSRRPIISNKVRGRHGLIKLYRQLAQQGFLLYSNASFGSHKRLPTSLVENNLYFLCCRK